MQFEWDERKRQAVLERRGLDFMDAWEVFEGPHLVSDTYAGSDPGRSAATGPMLGLIVTVIFTMRGDTIRIVTMRKARDDERRRHEALFGR